MSADTGLGRSHSVRRVSPAHHARTAPAGVPPLGKRRGRGEEPTPQIQGDRNKPRRTKHHQDSPAPCKGGRRTKARGSGGDARTPGIKSRGGGGEEGEGEAAVLCRSVGSTGPGHFQSRGIREVAASCRRLGQPCGERAGGAHAPFRRGTRLPALSAAGALGFFLGVWRPPASGTASSRAASWSFVSSSDRAGRLGVSSKGPASSASPGSASAWEVAAAGSGGVVSVCSSPFSGCLLSSWSSSAFRASVSPGSASLGVSPRPSWDFFSPKADSSRASLAAAAQNPASGPGETRCPSREGKSCSEVSSISRSSSPSRLLASSFSGALVPKGDGPSLPRGSAVPPAAASPAALTSAPSSAPSSAPTPMPSLPR